LFVIDFARGQQAPGLPDGQSRAGALTVQIAVEHGPTGKHDRWDVDGSRSTQCRRSGLIAAGREHHPIERVAKQDLDEAQVGEVAVERRGRAFARLLERVDRKLEGNTARLANAILDAGGKLQVMAVARYEIAASLGDADDGLARLQLLAREA